MFTLTGTVLKQFQLVEVYYTFESKDFSIICYVHDTFTQHVTVEGIIEYIKDNSATSPELVKSIVDPATSALDHIDMSKGIGRILCAGSVNKLRVDKVVHNKGLGMLLEPTIFGTAISGTVPQTLRDSVDTVCAYNIALKVVKCKICYKD